MSYDQFPGKSSTPLQIGSQLLNLDINQTSHNCPPRIKTFLMEGCGWKQSGSDPNTFEPLFIKDNEQATQYMYYKWYEAVSYEFWKFITINSGNEIT